MVITHMLPNVDCCITVISICLVISYILFYADEKAVAGLCCW